MINLCSTTLNDIQKKFLKIIVTNKDLCYKSIKWERNLSIFKSSYNYMYEGKNILSYNLQIKQRSNNCVVYKDIFIIQ